MRWAMTAVRHGLPSEYSRHFFVTRVFRRELCITLHASLHYIYSYIATLLTCVVTTPVSRILGYGYFSQNAFSRGLRSGVHNTDFVDYLARYLFASLRPRQIVHAGFWIKLQ